MSFVTGYSIAALNSFRVNPLTTAQNDSGAKNSFLSVCRKVSRRATSSVNRFRAGSGT